MQFNINFVVVWYIIIFVMKIEIEVNFNNVIFFEGIKFNII
jgi:hypothetical protein